VFLLGEWIFRFPRFAGIVDWLRREIALMPIVADAVSFAVPVFEKIGEPDALFPYPFVGYRSLPGVPCDQLHGVDPAVLAGDLGRALGELHAIDPALIAPPPHGQEDESWDWRAMLTRLGEILRTTLPSDIAAVAAPFIEGSVERPGVDGPRRFLHNDIGADHVLVDPDTSRLAGLIDFADMRLGDPAGEFTGLITIGPVRFIEDALAAYPLPVDDSFVERIRWNARAATLVWLADVVREGGPHELHLTWVRRAFEEP
jgi:aminoglycoside phosphotransferase (APT) family kinase protein